MKRTMNAASFNAAANHPDVRPWLGGEGKLDLTALVNDPVNVAFGGECGGFIFQRVGPGAYEAHSMITPDGRGSSSIKGAREAIRYLFTVTDCERVLTKIPDGNRAAAGLGRILGFREVFRREKAFQFNGDQVGVSFQVLTYEAWLGSDPDLPAIGHAFHEELEAAKIAAGSTLPIHDDEEAHDRAVGATCLTAKAGNAAKAVVFYNMWAAFAGFHPISLVSQTPVVIDIGDAVIEVRGDAMEVLQCR